MLYPVAFNVKRYRGIVFGLIEFTVNATLRTRERIAFHRPLFSVYVDDFPHALLTRPGLWTRGRSFFAEPVLF